MQIRDNFGNAYDVDSKVANNKFNKSQEPKKSRFNIPTLGLYFTIFLIVSKIIYLVFETYYNGYIIDVVSSTEVSKNTLDHLEKFGNNISAIGLTLLLLPLFYLVTKRFLSLHKGVQFIALAVLSAATFFGIKEGLYTATDKIVEAHQDKRYESYYIEMFKYGMLTGKLGYTSFIPKENLENLGVRDKIIISNLFLLTNFDQELIKKFVGIGQEKFFDIYVHKYFRVNYAIAREQFEEFSNRIESDWKYYNQEIKVINAQLADVESPERISDEYKKFTKSLQERYKRYRKNVDNYTKRLDASSEKTNEIYEELEPLFSSKGRLEYKVRYEHLSQQYFGKIVDPKHFNPLTKASVIKALEEQELIAWNVKTGSLPLNLTQKKFFSNPATRLKIVQELREDGINVKGNFNYSKKQFSDAYVDSLDSMFSTKKRNLQRTFASRTGHKNVKFGLSHKQFVGLYKQEIMQYNKREEFNLSMFNMLKNNDLSDFYGKVFKPSIRERYYDKAFPSVQDFNTHLADFGDQAIKMLYIPPFAITVSMIAGMLNFISLLSFIVFLVFYKRDELWIKIFKPVFKTVVLALMLILPYSYGVNHKILDEYPLLEKFKQTEFAPYISLMNWLLTVESFNYESLYLPIKSSGMLESIMRADGYEVDIDEATQNITGLKKKP